MKHMQIIIAALLLLGGDALQHLASASETKPAGTAAKVVQPEPPGDHNAFFGLDKIWDVHIRVPNHGWDGMSPEGVGYQARFPYTETAVQIAGHDAITVGLRFKGNATYWKLPSDSLKKSFKLDFNRVYEQQTFLGLKKLNINNNHFDQTQLREALSQLAYRESGVPAARTAFARVYLTLEPTLKAGNAHQKVEKRFLGFYTLVEQVDRGLLRRQTGDTGSLFKPEGEVLPFLGDTWNENYDEAYRPRNKVKSKTIRILIDLARLMDERGSGFTGDTDRGAFQARLEELLDIEAFLRYLAVSILIGNGDNWLFLGQKNYYLAVSENNSRVSFLPWDLNNSLGGMGKFVGINFEELSIQRHSSQPLVLRILELPKWRERYLEIVRELIEGSCSAERMTAALRVAQRTVSSAIALEVKQSGKPSQPPDLSQFFIVREKSVLDQLAGRAKGVEIDRGKKGRRNRK
jgi:spore coat protein H